MLNDTSTLALSLLCIDFLGTTSALGLSSSEHSVYKHLTTNTTKTYYVFHTLVSFFLRILVLFHVLSVSIPALTNCAAGSALALYFIYM